MPKYKRGTHKHAKGYPRVSAGPLRNQFIHRIVVEAMLGRPLKKDETIHHRDGNKLNFHPSNLMVLGYGEHGAVSAQQAWYFKTNDIRAKAEWDKYFDEPERES